LVRDRPAGFEAGGFENWCTASDFHGSAYLTDNKFRVDLSLGACAECDAGGAQRFEALLLDSDRPRAKRQVGKDEVSVFGSLEGARETSVRADHIDVRIRDGSAGRVSYAATD